MELSDIRELLNRERASALARIQAMTSEFDSIVASSMESNSDDEHDPEGSTIAFERARLAALLDEAKASLGDLDRSVHKLDEGRYGRCEGCGAKISPERLVALPTARRCIDCAASPTPRV